MAPIQQMLIGVGAKKKTYMDDVFSTYVYTGTGSARSINNGINLSGEGGMVWTKVRNQSWNNALLDTVRGGSKILRSNLSNAESNYSNLITSFNNNGYTLGSDPSTGTVNYSSSENYASWTFRKAPGFFDVVTWTGNGSNRTISHSLGSVPGMIMVKRLDASDNWIVYHRGNADSNNAAHYNIRLDQTNPKQNSAGRFNDTEPTASVFSVGTDGSVNDNGATYVAYLFAGGESTAATARSVDFDGSNDILTLASTSDVAFGTGDFTVEAWLNTNKINTSGYLMDLAGDDFSCGIVSSKWFYYNPDSGIIYGGTPQIGQWTHFAVSRSSGTTRLFINGEEKSSVSDSRNFSASTITIGRHKTTNDYYWDGKISNLRVVKGTAVYTSSFRPPTEPLTNITNTKLLCCNNSSTTGSTVTPGTITATGSPTASTDSPFDDPAGFKFGENGDQNVIKCGSYIGNGSNDGPDVFLGHEPQWLMVKRIDSADEWPIYDSMRGIVTGGNDSRLYANQTAAEYSTNANYFALTPTGFKVSKASGEVNADGGTYIYLCIRRADGYVGKPPELGTGVFAMATLQGSNPNFVSNFPVDFATLKLPGGAQGWYTGARLIQGKNLMIDENSAETTESSQQYDYQNGYYESLSGSYQAWMWKRHAGFDVVAYEGDDRSGGRPINHNLSVTPEMMWIKARNLSNQPWMVYHKNLGHGKDLKLNTNSDESNNIYYLNNTAPTSTHFTVGQADYVNGNYNYIAMLFASVDGISKVGSYSGSGSTGNAQNIGFQPRFLLIKRTNSTGDWMQFNSVGGFGNYMQLNTTQQQYSQTYVNVSSTGFSLVSDYGDTNESGSSYIYYAHA